MLRFIQASSHSTTPATPSVAHHRPFVHFREHIYSTAHLLTYIVVEITATVRLPTRLSFFNAFHQPSSAVRV
ncbi:hypothetical protein FPOAC1_010290 [Fusarium poae]|uniref:hypothetical protein n=1 Tax=Fusarium poae TaxID=36050 RepID=UPI001CEA1B01|nr:hypothetical protein FPOAC1_010290 [Fusarium poae]KAG8665494.1 hypothetical protein FPOAC1_010290 [Fusarium poae]